MSRTCGEKAFEERMRKAQDKVVRRKKSYERAVGELEDLQRRKRERDSKKIFEAFEASGRTMEQILAYLKG